VIYIRPNNIGASKKHDNPEQALKGALDVVERQVREQRERLKADHDAPPDVIFL